jgi:hypothetical protein
MSVGRILGRAIIYWHSSARAFREACEGTTAVVFSVALVPVMLMVAASVQYAEAVNIKAQLQQALDATVLSAVAQPQAQRDQFASTYFAAQLATMAGASASFVTSPDGTYRGHATAPSVISFGLLGSEQLSVSASSSATPVYSSSDPSPSTCIIALNPISQGAFNDVGITNVNAGCRLVVNSSNIQAVTLTGQAKLSTQANCIVGGVSIRGSATINPPASSCIAMTDPFSSYPVPAVGTCDHTNFQASSFNGTLAPGVYCGGIQLGSSSVTFSPGIYIINGGSLSLNSGSYTGSGVGFYFTGGNTSVSVGGNTVVWLKAPANGTLASFVFFFDPAASAQGASQVTGNSQSYYEGILYMPTQAVSIVGTSDVSEKSPFTAMIADTFRFTGNAVVTLNADPAKTSLPIPAPLRGGSSNVIATYRLQ